MSARAFCQRFTVFGRPIKLSENQEVWVTLMITFEKAGRVNTDECLDAAVDELKRTRLSHLVVASTSGDTALKAAKLLGRLDASLVVVTHNYGFKNPAHLEMSPETRRRLEDRGAVVHTGTMPFRNIGTAIRSTLGYSQQDLIANTLRLLGQGIKVCAEIAMMAADAGLIGTDDVITVAGTGRGADTAAVIQPVSSNRLFDMKIRKIIAKPFDW